MTPTGRCYVIDNARQQASGKHRGRWHLRCIVVEGEVPPGVRVHPIFWYKR